jgi:hypothetical protein
LRSAALERVSDPTWISITTGCAWLTGGDLYGRELHRVIDRKQKSKDLLIAYLLYSLERQL